MITNKKYKTREFSRNILVESLFKDEDHGLVTISKTLTDHTRWSVVYTWVFKFEDKYYTVDYSTGATEQQDEAPFEYDDDPVLVYEVEPKEETVITYKLIPEE